MYEVLESVRRIISNWVKTEAFLTSDALRGNTILTVTSSVRFRVGDEVTLRDDQQGEAGFLIAAIPDHNTIVLNKPIAFPQGWKTTKRSRLTKTFNDQFIKAIYIGDPDVIPAYPCITIMGKNRGSEWYALGLTKERYEATITILAQQSNDEKSYKAVHTIANIIQLGLKKNIFPLVGDYETTNVTANVAGGDQFIKVANSAIFQKDSKILLENVYQSEELRVKKVVNATTIQVYPQPYYPYTVADKSKVIALTRFIHNSWPSDIDFGYKYKGSLLHAASINWFGEEMEVQTRHGWSDPSLS